MTYLTKKHLSRRTVLRGVGVALGLPLLDAMIPRRDGARGDGGGTEAARRLLLYPARRDSVEHGVRQGDGPLVPERRRRRFQAEPDPLATREAQELRDVVLEPREQSESELRARDRARDLAQRRATRPVRDRRGMATTIDQLIAGNRSAKRPHCPRSRSRPRRRLKSPRARRAPAATTARRCRSVTRRRRCRWSSIRARCSRSCSARATRPRSATRSRRRRRACST